MLSLLGLALGVLARAVTERAGDLHRESVVQPVDQITDVVRNVGPVQSGASSIARVQNFLEILGCLDDRFVARQRAVAQVVDLFGKKDESSLQKFLGIVQIKLGNVKMLALLTSAEPYVLADGREHLLVFIPNSPIPATGFNVLVPADEVNRLDMPVEDMAKLMMSLGLLGPQVLRKPMEQMTREKKGING